MNIPRHKVFISYYHHDDQFYKNELLRLNGCYNFFDDSSVRENEIIDDNLSSESIRRIIRDQWMQNATVLLLLCGKNTKRRKHVDWEIHTAMYDSKVNPQMGIVVINLPTISQMQRSTGSDDKQFFGCGINWAPSSRDRVTLENNYPNMPSRIIDNFEKSDVYIPVVNWNTIASDYNNLAGLIDVAFNKRKLNSYDHSSALRSNNS